MLIANFSLEELNWASFTTKQNIEPKPTTLTMR